MAAGVEALPVRSGRDRAARGGAGFRVIGAFKLGKALLLLAVGFSLTRLMHRDVAATLDHLLETLRLDPGNHYLRVAIARVAGIDRAHLREIQAGTFLYALLYSVEGLGLLLRRRWAGYLTVVSTAALVPIELYELAKRASAVKFAVLLLNLGIVLYLLFALRRGAMPGSRRSESSL